MALLPSSSSSSITYAFTYDVFISFRGSDTRYDFTDNLYKALYGKGIHTFIDDKELHKGDHITPSLEKAIQKSRIFIVVLSKDYASSTFCLDELSKILDCSQEEGRLVWPVFYDVDPSDVRKQTGTYREAMTLHMDRFKDNKEKLQKWTRALQQVANLSGWHFKHGDGYEHEFIGKIVNEVSRKINRVALPTADYPVGLKSQVRQVVSLLDVGSIDRVHMVGIHGTGGIGKTTLALAVYNSIADHFEGLCFLENVRENSNKHGLLHLQKTLLLAFLGEKEIEITSVKHGSSIIQHRLQQKKVLLILDDVDKKEQLNDIIGRPNWLGPGSRVIITTRNQQLLACHGVERTYKVEELTKEDATELFTWKAFKNQEVNSSYDDLLNQALSYASGLPLALEVIGSNLFGKTREEWLSALEQYRRIPPEDIQKILKVSFDALEEEEKNVFLDIACCFKGYELGEVKDILCAHYGFCIENHIKVLVQKSLVTISYREVALHDLIEDMGKEIVRQESPKDLGSRSRLWSLEDIFEVLEENTGTSKIEMIHLDHLSFEKVDWDGEAFKEMKKLKTLVIRKTHFCKGPKHLPNSLRVLEWWNYPSADLPSDFHPKKLSICKLPESSLVSLELGRSSKKFVTMKVLNLNWCDSLTQIPNLFGLLNLEELSFKGCSNLIAVDCSVGLLGKLKRLNARNCSQLRIFPPLNLPSLEELKLKGCSRLESFPKILEEMKYMENLDLRGTNISEFPDSFGNLTGLDSMTVYHFLPSRSLVTMPKLELCINQDDSMVLVPKLFPNLNEKESSMLLPSKVECLTLKRCHLLDEYLVLVPSLFPNLQELSIYHCSITVVPECIQECRFLRKLVLFGCRQLREICEGILPRLTYLSVSGCPSLSSSCRSMLLRQELVADAEIYLVLEKLEGVTIPEWFEHQNRGRSPSLSFWFRNKFPLILLCMASPPSPYTPAELIVNSFVNGSLGEQLIVNWGCTLLTRLSEYYFDTYMSERCWISKIEWNHVEFMSESGLDLGIGIHVLKEQNMQDIRFTNPLDLNLAPLEEDDVIDDLIEREYEHEDIRFMNPLDLNLAPLEEDDVIDDLIEREYKHEDI